MVSTQQAFGKQHVQQQYGLTWCELLLLLIGLGTTHPACKMLLLPAPQAAVGASAWRSAAAGAAHAATCASCCTGTGTTAAWPLLLLLLHTPVWCELLCSLPSDCMINV
jgi:hypothetical protein